MNNVTKIDLRRAAFEALCKPRTDLGRKGDRYKNPVVQAQWETWQLCTAASEREAIESAQPVQKGTPERKAVLLKAAYDLFKQQEQAGHVINVLEASAHWDGTECDGRCLLEDIKIELDIAD